VEDSQKPPNQKNQEYTAKVEGVVRRHLKAEKEKDNSILVGLGMFGLVGWAVAIPTLLGIALGVWLDRRWPSHYSWTLMLLFLGLITGCINAWFWVRQSSKEE
jgi:ATP synthase protein I